MILVERSVVNTHYYYGNLIWHTVSQYCTPDQVTIIIIYLLYTLF